MRIERLDIRRYGVLSDAELLADGPVTLFYGPNEAGKSTVLGFIRDVLFGFPRSGSAERLTAPGEGGGQGGAITLVDEQGRRYRVERWERPSGGRGRGPAAGSVRVTFPDGTAGGERELAALLGGITPELFRSLFAFGLTELQELGTLQSGEVGSFLYSAGLGASGSVIRGADKKLAQELEQLYRPRGRTPLMNRALQELAAAEAELAQSRGRAERYNALEVEANRLAAEQETLESGLDKLQREADWLARCIRAQPHWLRREELRRELAELPETLDAFPADALPRMEAVLAERERLTVELDRVALALSDLKEGLRTAEAEAEAEGEVLERRAALEALLDRLPAYEEAKRTLAEAEAEEEQLGLELERMLRRIHPAWTTDHLDRLPSTVMLREEASAFREEWRVWRQNESLLEAEAEQVRSESGAEELGPADGRSGAGAWAGEGDGSRSRGIDGARAEESFTLDDDHMSVEEGVDRIRTARRLFHEWKEALREVRFEAEREQDREKLSRLEAQAGPETARSDSSGVPLYVLYGATLLLPAALAALQQTAAAVAALAVLLAASAAWTLARRRAAQSRSGRGRRPYAGGAAPAAAAPAPALAALREQAAARETALAAELRRLARYAAQPPAAGLAAAAAEPAAPAAAGRALPLPAEDIEPWLDALERQLRARQARHAGRRAAAERLAALRARRERHAEASEPLRRRWRAWLQAQALPAEASAEAALELLQLAEAAQQQLQRLRRQAARCEALRGTAAGFAAETAALLGEAAGREPGPALKAWQAARDRQLARLEQLARDGRQHAELSRQSALLSQQLERTAAKRQELLDAARADGEETLRHLHRQYLRRQELLGELRQDELAIRTLVGEAGMKPLDDRLANVAGGELEEERTRLSEQRDALREWLEACREAKSRKRFEIERLTEGGDHADKLQQAEERRTELRRLMKRWAVVSMCGTLFAQTKRLYEHEKQPSVMQRASKYFEKITFGRFTRMIAPLGEQRVLAERANGELLDASALSRGTAEQMYLCIRFALADEYAASGVRLPLVIDDLFVNFDDERLGYGMELLQLVSEGRQLLLFTCHKHVLDAYVSRFSAASVRHLSRKT